MGDGRERLRKWVEGVSRELKLDECVLFMTTCWATWERRNKAIFEGEFGNERVVITRVTLLVEEMRMSKERNEGSGTRGRTDAVKGGGSEEGGSSRHEREIGVFWVKPDVGISKINFDAGVIEGVGVCMAAVCRDDMGVVQWGIVVQRR